MKIRASSLMMSMSKEVGSELLGSVSALGSCWTRGDGGAVRFCGPFDGGVLAEV